MITIQILEPEDILLPNDWVRYMEIQYIGQSDYVQTRNPYGGTPINFFGWLPVNQILGSCWLNRPLGDFLRANERLDKPHQPIAALEFARGPIPKEHQMVLE